jgi:single-strand DNA-binding protein
MSIGDTYVTVQGWVGSGPDFKEVGRQPHVTFRIGSTPRQFDKTSQRLVDKPTTWFTVDCWRILAQNAFDSIRTGQPVIVTGRLRTHEWTNEAGEQISKVILEAFSIGHDLSRGTATFTKNPPRAEATVDSPALAPRPEPAETTAAPFPAEEFPVTTLPLPAEAA